jgi:hypothetical protein
MYLQLRVALGGLRKTSGFSSDNFFTEKCDYVSLEALNFQCRTIHEKGRFYCNIDKISRAGSILFLLLTIISQPFDTLVPVYIICFFITILITGLTVAIDFSKMSCCYKEAVIGYKEAISLVESDIKNSQKRTAEILRVIKRAEERIKY